MFEKAAQIKREICKKWGITFADLEGPQKSKYFCRARHEAIGRMRKETQYSLSEIGWVFGRRDHTTILHSIKIYKEHPEYFNEES